MGGLTVDPWPAGASPGARAAVRPAVRGRGPPRPHRWAAAHRDGSRQGGSAGTTVRWARGLLQVTRLHRGMVGNPGTACSGRSWSTTLSPTVGGGGEWRPSRPDQVLVLAAAVPRPTTTRSPRSTPLRTADDGRALGGAGYGLGLRPGRSRPAEGDERGAPAQRAVQPGAACGPGASWVHSTRCFLPSRVIVQTRGTGRSGQADVRAVLM
jgi:hypothetical protein